MQIWPAIDLLGGKCVRLEQGDYARETVLLNEYPSEVETLVQAIRIGELGIATSPCETFVEIEDSRCRANVSAGALLAH